MNSALCFTSAALLFGLAAVGASAQDAPTVVGIGAVMHRDKSGAMFVDSLIPDGPADKAGLKAGDYIIFIEGADLRTLSDDEWYSKVRGERGTKVSINVVAPGGQPRDVSITRDVVAVPKNMTVGGTTPPPGGNPQPVGGNAGPTNGPPPLPGANPAAPAGVTRFQRVVIPDPKANNVPAVLAMVPVGWRVEGGPMWMLNTSMAACLRMRMTDPTSGASAEFLPIQSFTFIPNPPFPTPEFGNYQGRIILEPTRDAEFFVQKFWREALPELQGVRAAQTQEFNDQAKLTLQAMANAGIRTQTNARCVRLRYQYAVNGRPFEADVFFTLASNNTGNNMIMWDVTDAFVARAPAGQLDAMAPTFRAIRQNTQMTGQWLASVNVVRDLFNKGRQAQVADEQALAATLAQMREHTAQVGAQIAADRDRSAQGRAEAFREVLGGVETHADPVGGQSVWLPAGYKDYWVNAKGEYLLSDQAGVDPNVGSTDNWQRMPRQDPMQR